jgi:CubicO group peptidase (beta-lactamase class C family)
MSRVDSLLDEGLERGLFAGVAAGIAGPGGVILETYRGAARIEPREAPVEPGTLWDLASLTKPLAGAHLALSLVDAGALELVSPVSRFADVFRKTRFDGVTIGHLLTHTSGMADWFPCYVRGEGRAYLRTLAEVDPTALRAASELLLSRVPAAGGHRGERLGAALGRVLPGARIAPSRSRGRPPPRGRGPASARANCGESSTTPQRALVAARKLKYVGFRAAS